MAVTGSIQINFNFVLSGSHDFGTPKAPVVAMNNLLFGPGEDLTQVSEIFADQRTLAASETEELDLSGVLSDALGATVSFTAIKGIYVKAVATNYSDILVGGSVSKGFDSWIGAAGDQVKLHPGALFALVVPGATGYAVTAGLGDLLKITNTDIAHEASYSIILVGT